MGKEPKRIDLGHGATLVIERPALSSEQTEAVYHLIAHIAAIHDAMALLKGTVFFSSDVEKRLDLYHDTKLKKVWSHTHNRYIADMTMQQTQMFREIARRMWRIGEQPEEIQNRFDRKMNDLFTECGVYMEYEPLQINPDNV